MKTELNKALSTLKTGGIILYPTDTIWGLGCDATNAEAVQKIYAIKKTENSKYLISLVANKKQLQKHTQNKTTTNKTTKQYYKHTTKKLHEKTTTQKQLQTNCKNAHTKTKTSTTTLQTTIEKLKM